MRPGEIDLDLAVREGDARNSIESIMSKVEKLDLEDDLGSLKKVVEQELLYLERKLQDMGDLPEPYYESIIKLSYDCLHDISLKLEYNLSESELRIMLGYIKDLSLILTGVLTGKSSSIRVDNKMSLIKRLRRDIGRSNYRESRTKDIVSNEINKEQINEINDSENNEPNFEIVYNSHLSEYIHNEDNSQIEPINISVRIKDEGKLGAELFTFWLLIDLLESIDDVKVELVDIKRGSLEGQLQVTAANTVAANQVITTIDQISEAVLNKQNNLQSKQNYTLTDNKSKNLVDNIDSEYGKAVPSEREKLEIEAIKLANERIRFENEKMKLANDRTRIENDGLSFQLAMDKRKVYVELLAEEIISRQEFVLLMKGKLSIEHKRND